MISAERNTIQMYLTQPQATDEFNPWMFPELAAKILFLGGLPLETRRTDLVALLSLFSEVVWLSMALDKVTGGFKGYAFTLLADDEKSQCLLQKKTIDFMGVKVGVLRWKASCDYINDKDSNLKKKVFLKGLEVTVDDAELYQYFSKFGTVEFAEVRRDHLTKQSRRIGFILFEKEEAALKCLEKKKHFINNKKVDCRACKSKLEKLQASESGKRNCSKSNSINSQKDNSDQYLASSTQPDYSREQNTAGGQMQTNRDHLSESFESVYHSPSLLDGKKKRQDYLTSISQDQIEVSTLHSQLQPLNCAQYSTLWSSVNTRRSMTKPTFKHDSINISKPKQLISPRTFNEKTFKKPVQIAYFTLPGQL